MQFFILLVTIGLVSASGAPLQNFAFSTHGQGSHFTMMQRVVPQQVMAAPLHHGHQQEGYPMVSVGQQPVAIPQKQITISSPYSHGGMGGEVMQSAPMAPNPRQLTLANTALGYGAAMKNIALGSPSQVPLQAPNMVKAADGPYAGFSVGFVNDKNLQPTAHFSSGAPVAHSVGQPTVYAPGPLGTYSPEKAALSSLPSKGYIQGTPIEMVTAQKTFFAGPGQTVGYTPGAGPHALAGPGKYDAPMMSAPSMPAHQPYGSDFAFAEKIFANAPAGLYGKPYTTAPLASKSVMVQ